MPRTHLPWGPAGSGKTTYALADATPQAPVTYIELEPGGFRRSAGRLRLSEGAVEVVSCPTPLQELETLLAGIPTLGNKGGLHADFSYKLDGWVETLNTIVYAVMNAAKSGHRPVIDTGTRFWYIVRQAYEEMVQKATGKAGEEIGQLKYTWPNKLHLQVHEFPIAYGLDVVWIAHQDTVFNSDPPIYKPDCWKELPGMVDVSLQFRIAGGVPTARIDKGAESGLTLRNLDIPYPTVKRVNQILDVVPILEVEGEEVPRDAEALITLAKLRGL